LNGSRLPLSVVWACSLLLAFAACSPLPVKPQSPRVTLTGLELVSVDLFEQRYRVGLRIKNPNAFELAIRGIDFRIDINDQVFADGVSNQSVDVPAYAEELVELEVSSSLLQVFRQLQSLEQRGAPGFDYRITGSVAIGDYGQRLPFNYSGEVSLAGPEGARPEKGI
jgi:LEA14-like dessication related protein